MPESDRAGGTLEVVVPVLNEIESIGEFFERVERIGCASAIIFVDNASRDGTVEYLQGLPGARIIRHERNLGYGASIRDGLAATRAAKVIIIDADLEYPPEIIPSLSAALDTYAVVYGSRFLTAGAPDMPLVRRLGNRAVSSIFSRLFGQNTTDFYTGVKGLRREAIDRLHLVQNGVEHVVEMGVQLARAGYSIREIPVDYVPRSRGTSKMRHLPEMLKYLWFITGYRLGLDVRRGSGRREAP